jgi:rhodanese-related sulfurtransferase
MFAHVAALARVFAHPVRVELVDLLAQAPRNVESHANVSQHLQQMRASGVVAPTRDGKAVIYALTDEMLTPLYLYLSACADHVLAEARRTRAECYAPLDAEPPLPLAALSVRGPRVGPLLLDVRPAPEFAHRHIPGALGIPVAELGARLDELPRARDILAYCRGPHCTYAHEAVGLLRRDGRPARRLEGGFLAWRACEIDRRLRALACP